MAKCALYRHFNAADELLYAGIAGNPLQRMVEHNAREAEWFEEIATITLEWHPSREDARIAERIAIVTEKPRYNRRGIARNPVCPDWITITGDDVIGGRGVRVYRTTEKADSGGFCSF